MRRGMGKLASVYLNILVTFILLIYAYFLNVNQSENWAVIISIISIATLFIQLISQKKLGFGIYDFVIYFFLFSHIFMFGNIYLIAIDKAEFISWGLIHRYEIGLLIESALFILCYLQLLNLGIVCFTKIKRNDVKNNTKINQSVVKKIGIVLVLISFPFKIFIDIKNAVVAQTVGTYYALETRSGISDDIATLFVPSIIFLINSSLNKKIKNILVGIFILYSILIMILTGDRRYQFIGIIVVLLNYFYINKIKFKLSKTIAYSAMGVLVLNMLTKISEIRQNSLLSVSQFFSEYWSKFFSFDFIYKIFGEFGLSFITVVIAIKNIPTLIPYQGGFSFWGAIPSIFPIGWLFPDFFHRVSIFRRLNEIEGYPVGASLPGELYANFGWIGLIIAFVTGGFIGRYIKFVSMDSSFKIAQYFSVFYILINLVRASSLEVTRNIFIIIIIPYLIYYFLRSMREKSN
ncbi:O-antigen polysaccharide polymerase Wzy-like protein [Cytobacillus oceanisediminis]|uniref:O-antigen polysaccharide polymerase Wzy-like protein n=1 Tax=Cytobacillus oceanisediminis TaxID=665099 RepID=A0A2V3A3V9_9BACI|nr:O-antigen polysaccharide polymerase Wzy [Cytobacillus oceanisediminis]PWW31278.1 O-antigen polysaccharide polymerase Wzy-like protein [Cytobacillus oceanisediminis]